MQKKCCKYVAKRYFWMSTPSCCFCLPKIHLLTKFHTNCKRTKVIMVYAAILQQICSNITAYSTFFQFSCQGTSFLPWLHLLTKFHTNLKRNKGSVMYATIMQQKCCKYAAKNFFFNEHPFWLFLSGKNTPNPKFPRFLQKNNPQLWLSDQLPGV